MHEQEGKEYDASAWIDPATVVDAILHVLDLPDDATVSDLTIRPTLARCHPSDEGRVVLEPKADRRVQHERLELLVGEDAISCVLHRKAARRR